MKFSPLFSLSDDLSHGLVPRFSSEGQVAPKKLSLIDHGQFIQAEVSQRTELEFNVPQNGASQSEEIRSIHVAPGNLQEQEILSQLDHGIWISNLHYLNWSDRQQGRLTGMTRHACFTVKNGKLGSPIEDLRFDDALPDLLGKQLLGLTSKTHWFQETGTYYYRQLGGSRGPGALIQEMNFAL